MVRFDVNNIDMHWKNPFYSIFLWNYYNYFDIYFMSLTYLIIWIEHSGVILSPPPPLSTPTILYHLSSIFPLVSCILYPYPVSCILYFASCILYPVSCILYFASCILYPIFLVHSFTYKMDSWVSWERYPGNLDTTVRFPGNILYSSPGLDWTGMLKPGKKQWYKKRINSCLCVFLNSTHSLF